MENLEGKTTVGAGEPMRGGFIQLWTLEDLTVSTFALESFSDKRLGSEESSTSA